MGVDVARNTVYNRIKASFMGALFSCPPIRWGPGQHGCGARHEVQRQSSEMKRLLVLLQRLTRGRQRPSLHTPEELECFKRDALENRGKHY
jgi:hypothetical protein